MRRFQPMKKEIFHMQDEKVKKRDKLHVSTPGSF